MTSQSFQAGEQAFLRGASGDANPHAMGTPQAHDWNYGFHHAKALHGDEVPVGDQVPEGSENTDEDD